MKKLIIALFLVAMLSMSAFAAVDSFREEFLQCMDGITGSPVRAEPPDPDSFREDVSRCLDGMSDPPGDCISQVVADPLTDLNRGSNGDVEPPGPDSFREDVLRCLDGAGDPPGDLEPIGPGLQG